MEHEAMVDSSLYVVAQHGRVRRFCFRCVQTSFSKCQLVRTKMSRSRHACRRLSSPCRIAVVALLMLFPFFFIFELGMTDWVCTESREGQSLEQHGSQQLTAATVRRLSLENEMLRLGISECRSKAKSSQTETIAHFKDVNAKLKATAKRCQRERTEWQQKKQVSAQRATETVEDEHIAAVGRADVRRAFVPRHNDTSFYNMSYPGVEAHTRYAASRSALSALTGVEPLVPGFGPVINHVFPFRYRISIPPCPDFFPKDSRTVFVAVISASHHFEKRRAIRNTWRTHLNAAAQEDGPLPISVGFAFVLGLPNDDETQSRIEEENDLHGDIIQIEMADVYNSLPRKVLGTLNWLHANCSKVDFAFKVDDDVYVNVRNLVQFVRNHHRSYHSVFGYGNFDRVPMRLGDAMSPEHVKWTITFEEYPWNTYPNYMSGPAYVLHGSTIRLLLAACQTTPMIRLEDVYITSMCAEKAGVKMQFSVGPSWVYFDPGRMVPTACGLRQYIAWPSENHTHSHTAVENFYSLNKTRCETINADGTYTPVDPHEPVHFRFSQTKTPASSTMIEQN